MEKLKDIIRDLDSRNHRLLETLVETDSVVMDAIADNDDMLTDNDLNVVTEACTIAAGLYIAAHAIALGVSLDSPAFRQQLREAVIGLSVLADRASPSSDPDDDEWQFQ